MILLLLLLILLSFIINIVNTIHNHHSPNKAALHKPAHTNLQPYILTFNETRHTN